MRPAAATARSTAGRDDQLTRDLAERLLGPWTGATAALLGAAGPLLARAALRFGEGPPNRRPAA